MTLPIGPLAQTPSTISLSAEQQAALALQDDARASRDMARQDRKDAQQQSVVQMQRVADKLRTMASLAIGSGLLQGTLGLASAACQYGSAVAEVQKTAKLWDTSAKVCDATRSLDGFGWASQAVQVDRQLAENNAKVADHRVQAETDIMQEAKRAQDRALRDAETALRLAHESQMAVLRP